jgi:hypothetical protein
MLEKAGLTYLASYTLLFGFPNNGLNQTTVSEIIEDTIEFAPLVTS